MRTVAETPVLDDLRIVYFSRSISCIYPQKLQKVFFCIDTQMPNRGAELFCVQTQKLQYWMICVSWELMSLFLAPVAVHIRRNSTKKIQKLLICVDTQIPNSDAELFYVWSKKLHREVVCAYPQKLQKFFICVHTQKLGPVRGAILRRSTQTSQRRNMRITSENSRKFLLAYIRRNSALCMERF